MKKDIVEDIMLDPKGMFMLFDDGLAYKNDLNDSTVTIIPWDTKKHGKLREILIQPAYAFYHLKNMFDVIAPDYNSFPIITEQGNIYTVDKELRISESYPASSLYWPIFTLGDRMCIHSNASGEQDIWVTTIQGIPEIKITVPVRGIRITKDKLYLYNNNHLYYISLDESAIKN